MNKHPQNAPDETGPRKPLNTRVTTQPRKGADGEPLGEDTLLVIESGAPNTTFAPPNESEEIPEEIRISWPSDELPAKGLTPKLGPQNPNTKAIERVIGFPLFGLSSAGLQAALKQIKRLQRTSGPFVPLIMTDSREHSKLRRAGAIIEYFPASVYAAPEQDNAFNQRFRVLFKKWSFKHIIDLGQPGLLRARLVDYDNFFQTTLDPTPPFNPRRAAPRLSEPAMADVAALKAEYLTKGLDQEPDTFVLYRVLGNDLPPRHEDGQTLHNLRFVLENEPNLPNCEKRWVINRIVNPEQERTTIALLEEFDQPYLHIPFDFQAYQSIEWDLENFPQDTFFLDGQYHDMTEYVQLRAQAHSRRHKNRYIMNNNGARNAALNDGRGRAKWVLPWDGNCFVTEAAWAQITEGVSNAPHLKYFTVPMARITQNTDLLQSGFNPEAEEEPQVVFRKDADEEFSEECHYGRRPKVDLFWRLGIPGIWDKWSDDIWDSPRPERSPQAGEFGKAGWVARMQSGRDDLEEATRLALVGRGLARVNGINTIIDQVDCEVLNRNLDPMALATYSDETLNSLAVAPKDTEKGRLHARLLQEADLALQRGPYSVTDKTFMPPSGDPQDYYHPSPYWWDASDSETGVPMYRDGLRAPGTRLYDADSDRYDRTRLQKLFDDTTFLALAGATCQNTEYHAHAAMLVRHWFITPETRMNPNLNFAQVRPQGGKRGGSPSGLIEMKDVYFFLDAVRLLERSGAFTQDDKNQFSEWLSEYVTWLQESPLGLEEVRKKNNHGTYYDLQVGSIAAYLGDVELLSKVFRRSRERIAGQFDENGAPTYELTRTQTQHYCAFNLQAWAHLASLADSCGDRLWDYTGPEGRGLAAAFNWQLSQQSENEWAFDQISPFDIDRYLPLLLTAKSQFTQSNAASIALSYVRKPVFFPHDGIMPFWMFSRMVEATGRQGNRDLQAQISRAERITNERDAQNATPVQGAKALEARIWGGYSKYAQQGLNQLKNSESEPVNERARAAWELARWQSFSGDFQGALGNTKWACAISPEPKIHLSLAEANFLTELGQPEKARKLVTDKLQQFPDNPNLFLQIANTYAADPNCDPATAEAEILAWFNKVYLIKGIAGIQKRDQDAPLDVSNLMGQNVPKSLYPKVKDTKVTVVFPVYNGADTIMNALRSVQEQTWSNLEIIVADDASTDKTCDIVKEMAKSDPRITLLELRDNRGAYVARNAGMEAATGEYVMVHDADDWSHPQKIEYQLNYLRKTKGALAVLSRWTRLRPNLFVEGYWRLNKNLFSRNQSSFLLPRALLAELGPWDNVRAGADNEFSWRFVTRYGEEALVETDPELPMSFGLVRDGSLTRQSATHLRTYFHGLRKDYRRTFRRWQQSIPSEELAMPNLGTASRKYPAPQHILPIVGETRQFEQVFIADFSDIAHKIERILPAITRATEQSDSVGIFHWPDYETESDANFHPEIGALIDSYKVEQISAWQEVKTKDLILADPYLAHYVLEGIPEFGADKLKVLCQFAGSEEAVFDERRRRMPTRAELEALFGVQCEWVHFENP